MVSQFERKAKAAPLTLSMNDCMKTGFRFVRVVAATACFAFGLLMLAYGTRAMWHYVEYVDNHLDAHRAAEWFFTGLVEIAIAGVLCFIGVRFLASRFRWWTHGAKSQHQRVVQHQFP